MAAVFKGREEQKGAKEAKGLVPGADDGTLRTDEPGVIAGKGQLFTEPRLCETGEANGANASPPD